MENTTPKKNSEKSSGSNNKWRIVADKKIYKKLKTLPKILQGRILDKLKITLSDPFHYFIKLSNCNYYKLRIGNYRIIAEIRKGKLIVLIIHLEHRNKAYQLLKESTELLH